MQQVINSPIQIHNPANIGRSLLVIGVVMIFIGTITAGLLYSSFATTLLEQTIYAAIGVIFALLGALLLPASGSLWIHSPILSFVVFMMWLGVLFPIGTQTHLGFMSLANSHLEKTIAASSATVKQADLDIDATSKRIDEFSQYGALNMFEVNKQKEALESVLSRLNADLAQCPANYLKNCINPLKTQISDAESKLQGVVKQIEGNNRYQALQYAKSDALKTKAQALSSGGSEQETVHPLFLTQSRLLSVDAKSTQAVFLAFSAVAYEILTALVLVVALSLLSNATQAYPLMSQVQLQNLAPATQPLALATQATTQEENTTQKDENVATQACLNCGGLFEPKVKHQKFCCVSCRNEHNGKNPRA